MLRVFWLSLAVFALSGASLAQVPTPLEGNRQLVGLFIGTCVRFAGNPAGLRSFMKGRRVPELTPEGRAIFLRGHAGVGFDTSNSVTRLALVSEDSGVCSAFAGRADSQVASLLETSAKAQGLNLVRSGGKENGSSSSIFYDVKINEHQYKLIVSTNSVPGASVQAAATLTP